MFLVELSTLLQTSIMKKYLIILMLMVLCSCGFKPLYHKNEAPLGKVSVSREVFVDVIPNREGQILRSLLKNRISTAGAGARYKLRVKLRITSTDLGLNIDDVATRKVLWMKADFQMLEQGKVIMKGTTSNNVSYAINDNEFTTMTARGNEIEKSLELIADDIKLKVSAFLNQIDL